MVEKNLYEKLLEVQMKLNAPKSNYNSFGKYNYRSCEDILQGVKPLLQEIGLMMIINDELVSIGNRYYIKATATVIDLKSSENISNTAYAREEESKKGMDGSQITGTASSYARKYALNGLLLIDDTKDADTNEFKETQNNSPKQETKKEKHERLEKEQTSETPPSSDLLNEAMESRRELETLKIDIRSKEVKNTIYQNTGLVQQDPTYLSDTNVLKLISEYKRLIMTAPGAF